MPEVLAADEVDTLPVDPQGFVKSPRLEQHGREAAAHPARVKGRSADGFAVFKGGTNQQFGVYDVDALFSYFEDHSPVAEAPPTRITRTN